ncbi:acyl carrier protein [Metarhizium robertsii]|uniref:Acyl carrier protein n=1 Tax=Metarhizium robertsii TaxID=568076 RepID=A0A0A1USA8_9HYPO|nr:acyl carrier protein [Metarhizium robertsii]
MPIQTPFIKDAQKAVFRKPQLPVLSPLDGTVVQHGDIFGPEYIVRHARELVQITKCLQSAFSASMLTKSSFAIEFSPHSVVPGMIRATLGSDITVLRTLRRITDPWEVLTKSLCSLYASGSPVKWDGCFADILSARKVIELPAYNWDLKSFWIPHRNDWTLTKGDIPVHQCRVAAELDNTIHEVLEERITSNRHEVVTECDVNRADVRPFIRGHTVDGFSLCTQAVYADIGFSIGAYALERFQPPFPERLITITDMELTRALVDSADWKQFLRCTAKINLASKDANLRIAAYYKLPNMIEHLDRMRRQLAEGKTCRFSGPVAYRLVSALAEFNSDHYCVDDVLYDNELYECIQVLFEAIRGNCQYFAHVRMIPGDRSLWEGDVTIFTDDRIAGLVEGIQEVPRRLLKFILTQAANPLKFKTKSAKETRSIPQPTQEGALDITFATTPAAKGAPILASPVVVAPKATASARKASPEVLACVNSLISNAIGIIAEQSGIPLSDVRDETRFDDIGIDSQHALIITSLFSEELGSTADSTLFLGNSTVAGLKRALGRSPLSSTLPECQGSTEVGDSTPAIQSIYYYNRVAKSTLAGSTRSDGVLRGGV